MKLNEEAPTQHLIIIVGGLLFAFINVLDTFKAHLRNQDNVTGPTQKYTLTIDEETGDMLRRETLYQNPQLSWWDRYLCRGYQRSTWCSLKLLTPLQSDFDKAGIEVPAEAPKDDHVVAFRGKLNKNMAFSSKLSVPE